MSYLKSVLFYVTNICIGLEEAVHAYNSYVKNRYDERYLNGNKPEAYKHILVSILLSN